MGARPVPPGKISRNWPGDRRRASAHAKFPKKRGLKGGVAGVGRRARPVELLVLDGKKHLTKAEKREREEREAAIRPPEGKLRPPAWLSEAAKKEFRRIVKLMEPTGLLTLAEVDELAVYCDALVRLREATELIERDGLVVEGARGPMQNPAVIVANKYAAIIAKLAPRLGLDPSGRASLAIPREKEKQADPFEEKFGYANRHVRNG